MKKFLAFIPFLLLINLLGHSQSKHFLDSLKNDLISVTDDSLRFRVLDELAWIYKRIDADSSLMYGEMGLKISEELDESLKAIILATIATCKIENRIDDLGISELKEAIEINARLGNDGRLGSNYHNIGNAYEIRGPLETAADYFLKAINIQRKLGDNRRLANALSGLGLVYEKLRDYEKAIEVFQEGLSFYDKDDSGRNRFYNNLGITYIGKKDYEMAKKMFMNIMKDPDFKQNEYRYGLVSGNLGECYFRLEQYDSAISYSKQSLEIRQKRNQNGSIAFPAFTLAKTFKMLRQFEKALNYAEIALADAYETEDIENIQDGSVVIEEIYAVMGDYAKAYEHLSIAYQYQDSLLGENKVRAVNEAQVKYDTEYKVWENELLKRDAVITSQTIKTQRALIIGSIIVVLLLILIALILRNQLRIRKKLNQQIENQAQKLKELDHAKTRFFANISHDLRSPLTLILGSLDKITERDYNILDNESKEMLDMGIRNGKRLLYLADEIMDLTRLEEGKISLSLEHVKIVPYLRLLTKMFSSAAEIKSIKLKFESDAEDESILPVDPHQFEKIIYNLLSNAIKFTPENGTVDVKIDTANESLFIDISDSGPGIPDESLELIFDRYYQSANNEYTSHVGVGIGLALVKELVELHQGTISVNSSESGTTFRIQFPYKQSNWVSQAIIPERSLNVVTRNSLWMDLQEEHERMQISSLTNDMPDAKTILIVEDHKELRFYLKSILSSQFRVFLASNGAGGLDILQSEKIDLIITDLMMPYMDGFELIDQLKKDKELKKIPVLVVSARTDQEEKVNLIKKGADDVISKPFDKDELYARISNILSREWDSTVKLSKLYGETAEEFEKSIMAKMERLIIKRIDDPHLTVLDLADEMAASERKVYRMIKKISGLTPYELIKEVRWQYLEKYLRNNKVHTATEAAKIIGMNNASSFSEQYKKRFGSSIKDVLAEN